MRMKRFKHTADILSKMISDRHLYFDFDTLANLGCGRIDINALDGTCHFNGKKIQKLSLAKALEAWLQKDLDNCHIPKNTVLKAMVTIDMQITPPKNKWDIFTTYHFDIKSIVVSGEDVYTDKHKYEARKYCKK